MHHFVSKFTADSIMYKILKKWCSKKTRPLYNPCEAEMDARVFEYPSSVILWRKPYPERTPYLPSLISFVDYVSSFNQFPPGPFCVFDFSLNELYFFWIWKKRRLSWVNSTNNLLLSFF